jgi:hypothetical protein
MAVDRLMARIEPDLNGGCWLWSGCIDHFGYGMIRIDGKTVKAHRLSWELRHGPIPITSGYHGTCVLHKCDVPACCNPDHLFLGSMGDNTRDRNAKGRADNRRGALNPNAKLTDDRVAEIRSLRGIVTQRDLACRFGVSVSNISMIQTGCAWRILNPAEGA